MAAAVAFVVAAAVLPAPAGAQVAWSAPVAERFIGGPSRAAVAPWGLARNPVTGELVVGDYLANRLRRYSVDGERSSATSWTRRASPGAWPRASPWIPGTAPCTWP